MSREDIANHLRLAPETVSRILTQMQNDGLIAVSRRMVTLVSRDRLRAMLMPAMPDGLAPAARPRTDT
jgi:CRP/FNR family transcriptional regulator